MTPAADVGHSIGAALAVTTAMNGRSTIDSDLETRPDPDGDIDIYQFNFQSGERLVIDLAASFSHGDAPGAIMRLFNSAGQELSFEYESPSSTEGRIEFTAPFNGVYFLGVSDIFHGNYNALTGEQSSPETPAEGFPTGDYQLHIRRLAADATILTGIAATADRGIPAHATLASANTGQVITLTGSGLRVGEQVVFITDTERVVAPLAVSANGSSLTVRVPADAVSGVVRLSAEAVGVFLQIVPTLDEMEIAGFAFRGERALGKSGSGLDSPATIHFGNVGFEFPSDVRNIGLNPRGVPVGPLTITTPGGTSAPFAGPDLVSTAALAASGVPADPSLPSANPGQTISLAGSRFTVFERFVRSATVVVFQTIDEAGNRREWLAEPTSVNPDGTQLTVVVPLNAVTGTIGVLGDPDGTTIVLQIVPVVSSVAVGGAGVVEVKGKGLIEGSALYRFGVREVLDGSISGSGVDVVGANDTAKVTLSALGSGSLTVTTAGGTSAPLPFGALMSVLPAPVPRMLFWDDASASQITPVTLRPYIAEALARFAMAGVTPERLRSAQSATWQVTELPGNNLGLFTNNTIVLDRNAAGFGWYIDSTPADDSEFTTPGNQGEQDRMDLLTVVMHELGHLLGLEHDGEGVMAEMLAAGGRRTEYDYEPLADQVFAQWVGQSCRAAVLSRAGEFGHPG